MNISQFVTLYENNIERSFQRVTKGKANRKYFIKRNSIELFTLQSTNNRAGHSLVALHAACTSRWSFHSVRVPIPIRIRVRVRFSSLLFCSVFDFNFIILRVWLKLPRCVCVFVCVQAHLCVCVCVLCLLVIPFLIRPGLDGFSISNLVSISNGSAPTRRASQTESISRAFHSSDSPAIPPAPRSPLATPTA